MPPLTISAQRGGILWGPTAGICSISLVAVACAVLLYHLWWKRIYAETMRKAVGIELMLYTRGDGLYHSAHIGPDLNDQTSTRVFQQLAELELNGSRGFGNLLLFDLFWAPGLPPISNGVLKADNNAWCLNAGVTVETQRPVPVVFTRNLHFTQSGGRVIGYLTNTPPFGIHAAVVATLDDARVIRRRELARYVDELRPEDIENVLRP